MMGARNCGRRARVCGNTALSGSNKMGTGNCGNCGKSAFSCRDTMGTAWGSHVVTMMSERVGGNDND